LVVGIEGGKGAVGGTCSYDGDALAAAEFRFREGLWRAAPKDAVEEAEVRYRRFGPVLATVFGDLPGSTLMNLVQGGTEPGAVEEGHLATAIEWVRSREVDYLVSVPADRLGAQAAEAWLAARGYERGATVRRFVHPATKEDVTQSAELEIRELAPLETEGMSHIFGDAFGLSSLATILVLGLPTCDGWHCYRASLEGREVACGAMLVAGKLALLGLDATLPDARGHGCQTALITKRLIDATRAGCDTIVAEVYDIDPVSPAAVKNLQRTGFEEIPGIVTWRRPTGIA
jgi:GNAT superfamily N-acetyltransferase